MPFRSKILCGLLLGAALTTVPMMRAGAAETASSDLVIIAEADVISDDLYAVANRIIIRGRIEGDLIALAGQDVLVEGEVTGSVTAIAAEVVVTGSVGGSLRALSPSTSISGEIGSDVLVGSADFSLTSGSIVGGDVIVWAWNAAVLGSIGGDVGGSPRHVELAGEVIGDVDVSATNVEVTGDLHVGGDFGYRSDTDAVGLDRATVDGVVVRKSTTPANIRLRALGLVARVLIVMILTASSLLVAWGWPDRTQKALEALRRKPLWSFLVGGLIIGSPLLLIGLAFLLLGLTPPTAALPLMVILAPVIIAAMGVVLVLSVVAGTPAAAWLGSVLARKTTIFGAIVLGSAVAGLVWLVPMVGWLVPLVMLTGGLGAWISTFRPTSIDLPGVLAAEGSTADFPAT